MQDADLIKVVSMPEGLAATEVGREFAVACGARPACPTTDRHQRILTISEAILLSLVTLVAAWSGYAAAKWSTESSVRLAESATAQTTATAETYAALDLRNFDASTFNTWFSAYAVGNKPLMAVAARRFRPAFRVAFDAWRATNGHGPPGPTYMPQYKQPELARASAGRASERRFRRRGEGGRSFGRLRARDDLPRQRALPRRGRPAASLRGARYALVGLGSVLLLAAAVQIIGLPLRRSDTEDREAGRGRARDG